jgi:hypothetical protein
MDPRPKKSAARKRMRVATAFTGAVTCAAAFTPAAFVGTARAASYVISVKESTKCASANSIHVATSTGGSIPVAKSTCFYATSGGGNHPTLTVPGTANYFAACPGSYSGYYSGISHSGHGAKFKDTFKKGKKFVAFPHNGPIKNFTVHISASTSQSGYNC